MNILLGMQWAYIAMWVGMGLTTGVMIYITLFKVVVWLLTKLSARLILKTKPFNRESAKGDRVLFMGTPYFIQDVFNDPFVENGRTFKLIGNVKKDVIIVTIEINKGA